MRRLMLSLVAAAAVACASSTAPSDPDDAATYYRQQFQQKVGGTYQVTVQNNCFCPVEILAPVRIVVQNGSIAAVTRVADGASIPSAQWAAYRTVDQVFTEIRKGLDDGNKRVEVEYDEQYGYPTDVLIDLNMAADAFIGFKLSGLETSR